MTRITEKAAIVAGVSPGIGSAVARRLPRL